MAPIAMDVYTFPCKLCGKVFGKPAFLEEHVRRRHPEEIIERELEGVVSGAMFIGEESEDSVNLEDSQERVEHLFLSDYLWAVDPIDGTLNFVSHYGEWGVSVGLLKREKEGYRPCLGAVYLPLTDKLYYTDANQSYVVSKASSKHPSTQVLQQKTYSQQELTQGLFVINESKINKYRIEGIKNIRVPGSTVVQFVSTAAGESIGTITSGHIWDIAASLAIGQPLGLSMYEIHNGKESDLLDQDSFVFGDPNNNWKLKKDYLVSNHSAKSFLLDAVK